MSAISTDKARSGPRFVRKGNVVGGGMHRACTAHGICPEYSTYEQWWTSQFRLFQFAALTQFLRAKCVNLNYDS